MRRFMDKETIELISSDYVMTQKECDDISLSWEEYRTSVSKFFGG